ncbi:bioY protein [Clostridium sp. CAG:557]|jgi:biotin transport system substrate-specific component|nr:bioY protein [Clostridium sp. CAG:557]
MRKDVLNLTMSALFVAAMSVSGTILKIPLPPPIPSLSMQFFFSTLAGIILGSKLGAISMMVYILLGLSGLPIFTTGGGIGYIFYPSFGYILGFVGSAFIAGLIREWSNKNCVSASFKWLIVGNFLSLIFVYFCGTSYLYLIKNFYTNDNISIINAIQISILSFIPTDSIWCLLSAIVGKKLLNSWPGFHNKTV